jgi:5'-methylthioinosine phosphorylase
VTAHSLGIVGGSGGAGLRPPGATVAPGSAESTPWGEPSGPLWRLDPGGARLLQLRHGDPHRHLPHAINYRANLWQLHRAGVGAVVGINTVGAIAPGLPVGALVVPEQLVDYTHGRPASFEGAAGTDGPHVDFGRPFDAALVARLVAAAAAAGLPLVRGGTYGVTQGPRLETAAEIDRLERDGCSLVGMTAMPEAVLARELRLPYALVCIVVNPAAGRGAGPLDPVAMGHAATAALAAVARLLAGLGPAR